MYCSLASLRPHASGDRKLPPIYEPKSVVKLATSWGWGGVGLGLAAGALVGAALTAPWYGGYDYGYGYPGYAYPDYAYGYGPVYAHGYPTYGYGYWTHRHWGYRHWGYGPYRHWGYRYGYRRPIYAAAYGRHW